ncbi:MAG: hypothetical protein WEF86_00635 [Gemmatimonadota bacterium]
MHERPEKSTGADAQQPSPAASFHGVRYQVSDVQRHLVGRRNLALLLVLCTAPASGQAPVQVDACAVPDGVDRDHDGLSDECERELARAFAPHLVVRSGGCDWDESVSPHRIGGGYRFAVEPYGDAVRIAYLPAYFVDCGWSGWKCYLPGVDCSPHAGDSEFMLVEVRSASDARTWTAERLYLSAHCFGRSGSRCRWYDAGELAEFQWIDGAPIIWVAEGRHANYPSERACDEGHHSIDTCDRHDARFRFPVDGHTQNIGSSAHPTPSTGCITGRMTGSSRAVPDAVECMWSVGASFGGWQAVDDGATGYWRYLYEVAGLRDK